MGKTFRRDGYGEKVSEAENQRLRRQVRREQEKFTLQELRNNFRVVTVEEVGYKKAVR